jgi:hypothetical protein
MIRRVFASRRIVSRGFLEREEVIRRRRVAKHPRGSPEPRVAEAVHIKMSLVPEGQ